MAETPSIAGNTPEPSEVKEPSVRLLKLFGPVPSPQASHGASCTSVAGAGPAPARMSAAPSAVPRARLRISGRDKDPPPLLICSSAGLRSHGYVVLVAIATHPAAPASAGPAGRHCYRRVTLP